MSSYHKKMMAMLDGVEGMDDTSASLVRWAQNAFGDAGGDVARAVVQAPATFARGIGGGAVSANAGINQMLRDYTPLGALPVVGYWLQDAANQGSKDAARIQSGATANYQTAIGRDVGQGINSLGATAPLTAAAVATKNPAIMYGGMGAQTGFTEYGNARQAGLSPLNALSYAGNQTAIETATEKLPAGALVDAFKTSSPVASLIKSPLKYALGEAGGEQLATLGQDFIKGAYIDSQTNDNWLQDYQDSRLDAARSTLVSSLVAGGGNVAIGSVSNAAAEAVGGNKSNRYKRLMAELDKPQSGNANQVNQFLKDSVVGGGMKTRNDIPTVRQATQQNIKYRQASPKTINDLRAISQNPNMRKMLNLISHTEGTEKHGYNTLVGGGRINDLGKHPNKVGLVTGDGASTAFGRYQIVGKTWRGLQKQYGFTDMNPASQDAAAVALIHQRGALNDVLNGNYKAAINKLGDEWVSLPSSTNKHQGKRSWARVEKFLNSQGAGIESNGQPFVQNGLDDDMPIQGANMYDDNQSNIMRNSAKEQEDAARAIAASAEEQAYQARRAGRATRVFLDGKMQDATLELMDADELTPAVANTDNQYRDRSRAASQVQINQIANNLEPELLGDSKQIDSGAPTLAADGQTIIGGNGRVMAINQAYEQGNGDNYRQYLVDNAEQFGLNPDDIAGMNKPILVRRFVDASIDTNKAAVASNEGGWLGMSALEQARVDAERLPDFGTFVPADNGELNTPANRGFIRDFVGSMPTTVQAQMIGADGQLSQDGVRRFRNAMLYSAYGNSPALSRMVESTDAGMKNMVNAMMQVAPTIAKAKNHIKDGAMHSADISDDIVSAVEKINQIHESGGSVADYLAQQGMFEDDLSPVARELVAFFDEHRRSAKAITTLLKNYYDLLAAQGNPADADMFGGDARAPDKQQLLNESINTYERQHGKQQQRDIFTDGQSESNAAVGEPVSETEQQPAGSRSDETGVGENTGGTEERNRESSGIIYSRSEPTRTKYEQRIDELFNGAKADKFGGVTVLDRADILDMLGYGDMPLRLVEGKVIAGQTNHPLMTADVWKKIPDWVDSPAMVFDSDTVDGRLVFIAPEKVRGNDVRIVIEPKGDELQAHMLVNAYDKDTSSPYLRWANDRLLRYVDKTKAARINERFGLRLPDILKNPSLAPSAQIHGMDRGNTKDLRLGKILTEKNLQGYRKNNPDKRFERGESRPSEISSERIAELESAVVAAIGKKNAAMIDIVSRTDVSRPDNAQDLLNAQGWFDPQTGRITLIAENIQNEDTAKFVAWHELAHKKIRVDGFDKWQSLFKQADGNAAVKRLTDAIMKQRRGDKDAAAVNRIAAVEEAIAELYAAKQENNIEALERKYGITMPAAFKDGLDGYLSRVVNRIKNILKDVLGISRETFSDGQVFGLLKRVDSIDAGQYFAEERKVNEQYSRASDDEKIAYEKARDAGETELTFGQWKQVRTPEFKSWFGDWENDPENSSKVINPRTGEPLVVYHGTNSYGFNIFDSRKTKGVYFSSVEKVAKSYDFGSIGGVYDVFLNIRNPGIVDFHGSKWDKYVSPESRTYGEFIVINQYNEFEARFDNLNDAEKYANENTDYDEDFILSVINEKNANEIYGIPTGKQKYSTTEDLSVSAKSKGKDGSIFKNTSDNSDYEVDTISDIYVAFNSNQIKSATGNNGQFSADNDDILYSSGNTDMSKKERVLFNELGELQIGLAAYNKLGEVIKPLASKAGLANGYHENFTQYMRDHMASINAAGRTAKQIAEMGKKLTESERKLLSDVLEKELPEGAEVTPKIQELADTVRTIFNQQTDDLVALEMVSKESAERFRDTYLPRMYNKIDMLPESIDKMQKQFNRALRGGLGKAIAGKHLKGRGLFKEVNRGEVEKYEAQGFEIREDYGTKGQKANKVLMWRDFTREERTAMGEERDAMLRFSVGYIRTQSDIAKGMLFKRIASDENLASITPVDGWVRVSDAVIADTGGVKRYGALAGMYVHPHVEVALRNQFYVDGVMQKIWRSMLGWWKITKTVYNPVAHVNNVVSNIVMTQTAGATPKDIAAGAIAVKDKNALYQEALEHGLVGEAVDVAGIKEMFVGINNVSDGQLTDLLITRAIKLADKLTGQVVSKTAKFAQDSYRAEDEVFRMALYKMARDRGLNPKEAADYAYTFMFDYADVPPTIRKVRDLGILPFISYTYKAVPAMARLALTRPHRMLAVTLLMYGINAMSYLLMGEDADEEEERENMPEYQKGYTIFGTPKLIRLPWNDLDGKPMFIDVYRWLPLGDFADTQNQMGGIPLPQWLTPNGPVINHTLALLANKDTFTGKEVVKDYQSTEEKAKTYGKWLASQWLPASVGVPYSYHTNNVLDGLKNQFEGTKFADVLEYMGYTGTDSRGDGKQLYRAALGSVGVKIRGEDPAELKARKARYIRYQIREAQADMRRISRDNRLTDDSKRSKIESRREHIKELQRQLGRRESETD
ncbi:MuF-C-terminal domain-containing protein [Neisseria dentiae]|nr:hypothetical protein [Neisseria dentiae]QMT44241.1 hypothetical protein H3L92_07010 [Neisseria dentiae]STZ49914.1 putative phage associated protein [Neisseria dentiae]